MNFVQKELEYKAIVSVYSEIKNVLAHISLLERAVSEEIAGKEFYFNARFPGEKAEVVNTQRQKVMRLRRQATEKSNEYRDKYSDKSRGVVVPIPNPPKIVDSDITWNPRGVLANPVDASSVQVVGVLWGPNSSSPISGGYLKQGCIVRLLNHSVIVPSKTSPVTNWYGVVGLFTYLDSGSGMAVYFY